MCGDGCYRNVWRLGPGISLENIAPQDIIIYDNKERMVVDTLDATGLKTVRRGANNEILSQILIGYDLKSGEFAYDFTCKDGLYDSFLDASSLDKDMMGVGL